MDTHAASFCAGRALGFQRTLDADVFGKVNDTTGHIRHFLLGWAANDLPVPIQDKCLLGKALPLVDRPGFAIDVECIDALTHKMAAQVRSVDMEFLQDHRLPFQICADLPRNTGFWRICSGDACSTNE